MLLSHLFSAKSATYQICLTYLKSHEGGDNQATCPGYPAATLDSAT